jgi:hypothetical protein
VAPSACDADAAKRFSSGIVDTVGHRAADDIEPGALAESVQSLDRVIDH